MTHDDIRRCLFENSTKPKEIRTNDGRTSLVCGIERWAPAGGRLAVLKGAAGAMSILSIRNIAAIGAPSARRSGTRA